MKIKLLALLTGTFLGVAYLVGCGGGGNNNNSSCPAGQTYVNGVCQVGVGANGYAAQCASIPPGTVQYQQCMAQYGGGGCPGYAGGVSPYGYSGSQYGYNNGVNGVASYPGQNCGPIAGGGYYPGGSGVYPPYPPQGGGYFPPYPPYGPMPPPYYGPYAPPGISWGVGVNLH